MAQLIKSKNLSAVNALLLWLMLVWCSSPNLHAATNNLPVIRNVGVIPVQFEGSSDLPETLSNVIRKSFEFAIRESRRFRLIDNDLVETLWVSPKGRAELKSDYELDVYALLSVDLDGDILNFAARITDSNLKTILQENDRHSIYDFKRLDHGEIQKHIENLTFRLVNRLPNDVHVTSIQGPFVTLSGGHEQGIEPGDQIEILRSEILAVHPANGTWVDFRNIPKGAVQVIDAKDNSSVARIVRQTNPRAIQVGDGAKIQSLPSRVRFARLSASNDFIAPGTQNPIVMPPIPVHGRTSESRPLAANSGVADADKSRSTGAIVEAGHSPNYKIDEDKEKKDEKSFFENINASGDSIGSAWSNFSDEAMSHKLVDDTSIYAGPSWWSVRGPADTSGSFPWWLLNSFGVGITRTMFYKIKAGFGGGGLFGQTPDGSYYGYNGYGQIYWESPLDLPVIKVWRAGAQGNLSGISVTSGSFGGGDFIRGGIFGGLGGHFVVGEGAKAFDWNGFIHLSPLNIGRMGYGGSFKEVESAMGWKFDLSVFEKNTAHAFDLGGGISWGDERVTLKNGRRFHLSDYGLKALLRYRL
jgi:hypothetical protein